MTPEPMDRPAAAAPMEPPAQVVPISTDRRWRWAGEPESAEALQMFEELYPEGVPADVAPADLGPARELATVMPIRSAPVERSERKPAELSKPRTLRKPPSDNQWRQTMQALDSSVGYLADPDTYTLLAAAREVSRQDATEWLAAHQAERVRRKVVKGEVPPASPGGSGGRSSGISDPTGNAVATGVSNPDAELWALLLIVERAAAVIVAARSGISRLAYRRGDAEAREKKLGLAAKDKVSQGSCAVMAERAGEVIGCDHWCRGEGDDRLKNGLCPKHHTRWTRWKKEGKAPDIGAFISHELTLIVEAEEARAQAEAEEFAARAEARARKVGRAA